MNAIDMIVSELARLNDGRFDDPEVTRDFGLIQIAAIQMDAQAKVSVRPEYTNHQRARNLATAAAVLCFEIERLKQTPPGAFQ